MDLAIPLGIVEESSSVEVKVPVLVEGFFIGECLVPSLAFLSRPRPHASTHKKYNT